MRHRFESIHKSLDLGHHATFRDNKFQTDDAEVAAAVRRHMKAYPNEIWEAGNAPKAVTRKAAKPPKAAPKTKHKPKGG